MQGECTQNDVLVRAPVDYCIHEPCMQRGVCVSQADTYVCHCTARFSGKNCEIDQGSPCNSNPCNSGKCIEDSRGDYSCNCPAGVTGAHCEIEITVHPLCENKPCLNDGICTVVAGTSKIECDCAKGFTGSRCEVKYHKL